MTPTSVPARLFDVISTGDLDDLDDLLHPEFTAVGAGGQELDREQMRAHVAAVRAAFPDLHVTVLDLVDDGARCAWRVEGQGTHTGTYLGVPGTGRRVRFGGVDLAVVENGRVRTLWSGEDVAGVLLQIGALPTP
jgi:predicted ester cyclase